MANTVPCQDRVSRYLKCYRLVGQNARIALQVADRGYVLQTGQVLLGDTAEKFRQNEMVRKAYLGITWASLRAAATPPGAAH